jgi:3-oxoadipate enol-lactonase
VTRELSTFRTSDELSLRYVVDDYTPPWRQAETETLILLHAAMGTHERLYAWVPHLAGRYRVVRWDMRGHGASDKPGPDGLSIERLSRDLVELMDHLGIASAHVAGSSAGGIVAMHAAVSYPARIRTLAAYAAIPGLKASAGHTDYEDWMRGLVTEGVRAFLKRTIRQRFDVEKVDPGFIEWFLDVAAQNDPQFLARYVRMMSSVDFTGRIGDIRCPSLFVIPGGDPNQSPEHYAVLRAVPNHEMVVYAGLPHNITDAVPDRCARDLAAFLQRHSGAVR